MRFCPTGGREASKFALLKLITLRGNKGIFYRSWNTKLQKKMLSSIQPIKLSIPILEAFSYILMITGPWTDSQETHLNKWRKYLSGTHSQSQAEKTNELKGPIINLDFNWWFWLAHEVTNWGLGILHFEGNRVCMLRKISTKTFILNFPLLVW